MDLDFPQQREVLFIGNVFRVADEPRNATALQFQLLSTHGQHRRLTVTVVRYRARRMVTPVYFVVLWSVIGTFIFLRSRESIRLRCF